MNIEKTVSNLEELREFWASLLPQLKERCLILLVGEVGSGKTTSVQMIADILKMKGVQSPSFAIHLCYQNNEGKTLDHLDLYRLENEDDLESTGFWDLFAKEKGLVIIEWADRLNVQSLPMNWQQVEVRFVKTSDQERVLYCHELPNSGSF